MSQVVRGHKIPTGIVRWLRVDQTCRFGRSILSCRVILGRYYFGLAMLCERNKRIVPTARIRATNGIEYNAWVPYHRGCGQRFQRWRRRSCAQLFLPFCCLQHLRASVQRRENHGVFDCMSLRTALCGEHNPLRSDTYNVVRASRFHQVLLLWNAKGMPTLAVLSFYNYRTVCNVCEAS